MIAESFSIVLGMEPHLEVAGIAGNGKAAVELCKREAPDLILMDIHMPEFEAERGQPYAGGQTGPRAAVGTHRRPMLGLPVSARRAAAAVATVYRKRAVPSHRG